jgi:hypothetical protein
MKIKFSYIDGGVNLIMGPMLYWHAEALDVSNNTLRYNRYMCGILSSIAQEPSDCDRILSFIAQVKGGEVDQVETGGNDVTFTIKTSGIQVDIEINENWIGQVDGHFTLEEWQIVLNGWRQFLKMPATLKSTIEVDLGSP